MRLDSARRLRRSGISLTPLIDVVFILLLFFMLTSRFQHYKAMALNVPAADSITASVNDIKPVSIELQSDGSISINGATPVDQNMLAASSEINNAMTKLLPVHVSTTAEVTLSTLTQLMDQLSARGLSAVSLRGLR